MRNACGSGVLANALFQRADGAGAGAGIRAVTEVAARLPLRGGEPEAGVATDKGAVGVGIFFISKRGLFSTGIYFVLDGETLQF